MIDRRSHISTWSSMEGRGEFVPSVVAQSLSEMATNDPNSVILEEAQAVTAVVVDQVGSDTQPSLLQLLALRRFEDRPLQFTPGSPLSAINLPNGYFTADITHVCIWPDGFAAQDFHSDAPRLSRLSAYLRKKTQSYVQFDALYDPSVVEQLQDIAGQIRGIDVALTSPDRSADSGVFANLIPAALGEKAPSVGVRVGMGRYGPRDAYLDSELQDAAIEIAQNASELVDRMVLVGRSKKTGKTVTLNLLTQRLGDDIQLEPESDQSSLPAASHAFEELQRVFNEARTSGRLEDAARAQAVKPK